ncbi:MAG: hypothetical protein AB7I50_12915, partial [Vicinamibacterales bacterium]
IVTPQAARQENNPHATAPGGPAPVFDTAENCMPCHNNLISPTGEDISIGSSWRASMMANAGRDPYWMAGIRRETMDHPSAVSVIEDECTVCHLPMARTTHVYGGGTGKAFEHLPVTEKNRPIDKLAHDGVSCTACHQMQNEKLGTRESFVGGYVIRGREGSGRPHIFGPFQLEKGQRTIMRSASNFEPERGDHIKQSEMCATCHTLFTKALDKNGKEIGELSEQAMYLEWKHSAYEGEQRSCQSCHMPVVQQDTPIASVLGDPRPGFSRHTFVGGNFFMLKMLNKFRDELGVQALPHEMEASVQRTLVNLQQSTARLDLDQAELAGGRLSFNVNVTNLTGHKLPTAYPSRRAWLHVTVRDQGGRVVFESGAIGPNGAIAGNDNDADALKFEPHYTEIRRPDDVQIYESVMVDGEGVLTTGLLRGVRYVKDNRLLPRGFDKATASNEVAVLGGAMQDADFLGGSDRVRYSVDLAGAQGPFRVDAELRFQVIAFRWAENLKQYDAPEPRRFVGYYQSMSSVSSEPLAQATLSLR